MKTSSSLLRAAFAGAAAAVIAARQAEPVDTAMVAKIRDEGLNRSRVQAAFNQFVDVIGPRLTASPDHKRAAEWAREELTRWGLSNARLEPFEFGRGWALDKFTIEMVEPRFMPLVGYPEAWSPSTAGELVTTVVSLAGAQPEAVKAMAASLKGAAVMTQPIVTNFIRADRAQPSELPDQPFAPPGARAGGRGGAGQPGAAAGRQGGGGGREGAAGGPPTPQQQIDADDPVGGGRRAPAAQPR